MTIFKQHYEESTLVFEPAYDRHCLIAIVVKLLTITEQIRECQISLRNN